MKLRGRFINVKIQDWELDRYLDLILEIRRPIYNKLEEDIHYYMKDYFFGDIMTLMRSNIDEELK